MLLWFDGTADVRPDDWVAGFPAYAFLVYVGTYRRFDLDPLEEVILALASTGSLQVETAADMTAMPIGMVESCWQSLINRRLLTGSGGLTPDGEKVLKGSQGNKVNAEWGYLFQDARNQRRWFPVFHTQALPVRAGPADDLPHYWEVAFPGSDPARVKRSDLKEPLQHALWERSLSGSSSARFGEVFIPPDFEEGERLCWVRRGGQPQKVLLPVIFRLDERKGDGLVSLCPFYGIPDESYLKEAPEQLLEVAKTKRRWELARVRRNDREAEFGEKCRLLVEARLKLPVLPALSELPEEMSRLEESRSLALGDNGRIRDRIEAGRIGNPIRKIVEKTLKDRAHELPLTDAALAQLRADWLGDGGEELPSDCSTEHEKLIRSNLRRVLGVKGGRELCFGVYTLLRRGVQVISAGQAKEYVAAIVLQAYLQQVAGVPRTEWSPAARTLLLEWEQDERLLTTLFKLVGDTNPEAHGGNPTPTSSRINEWFEATYRILNAFATQKEQG